MGFIKITGHVVGHSSKPGTDFIINTDQIRMVLEGVIYLLPVQEEEGAGLGINALGLTNDAILDLIARAGVGVAVAR